MEFGVAIFPTDYTMNLVDLGREVEAAGFESLFLPEHTHIPTSRRSPWPGGPNLPREYLHTFDPFVTLGAIAATTSRLRLGTGVCLVVERDPITLAKAVSTLDQLSNGRVLFGVGGGWNEEEMAHHGTDPRRRWRVLRERIQAMQAIWTRDEAEFHGEFVNFDPIWQWPKPVQRPHPPILVGGNAPRTLERVLEYGDGWMPIVGRSGPDIIARIGELHQLCAERERRPIPVSAFVGPADPQSVERFRAAGAARYIFLLPSAGADEVLAKLRRCAELMQAG